MLQAMQHHMATMQAQNAALAREVQAMQQPDDQAESEGEIEHQLDAGSRQHPSAEAPPQQQRRLTVTSGGTRSQPY